MRFLPRFPGSPPDFFPVFSRRDFGLGGLRNPLVDGGLLELWLSAASFAWSSTIIARKDCISANNARISASFSSLLRAVRSGSVVRRVHPAGEKALVLGISAWGRIPLASDGWQVVTPFNGIQEVREQILNRRN